MSEGRPSWVDALASPEAYPHPASDIRVIQTHVSWVFLAGEFAYKAKKAVDYGFLDYSTLRRRWRFCRREVVLNQRLSQGVYLGVVPICLDGTRYRIGGPGRVVEYAVKMRRLPADRMLDALARSGKVTPEQVEQLARVMAEFHARAASGPRIRSWGLPHILRRNWRESLQQLASLEQRWLSGNRLAYLEEMGDVFLARHRKTFLERVMGGRVRDCHGDLRAGAICLDAEIQILDCIEFNRRFRYGDVASEVAFLGMDLEHLGRPDLARAFTRAYAREAKDWDLQLLLPFYCAYRATVRSKVEALRALDPSVPAMERDQARREAEGYLADACRHGARAGLPLLMITYGLSGSGKTTLAHQISQTLPCTVISSDRIRKKLAGLEVTSPHVGPMKAGLYAPSVTRRVYREMLRAARPLLEQGQWVLLDATFLQRWQRRAARRLARWVGAFFFCLECGAEEEVIRGRLEARDREGASISDARLPVYLAQRRTAAPPRELGPRHLIQVDMSSDLDACVGAVKEELGAFLFPADAAQAPNDISLAAPASF